MIIIFGPTGAGKSVQGQIIAARHGWRWLSAGQLLRDAADPALLGQMQRGELVDDTRANEIVKQALIRAGNLKHVVLDGFPRRLPQAQWLLDSQPEHGRSVNLVVVLDVPHDELVKRLSLRGRTDDTPEAVEARIKQYTSDIEPIIELFRSQGVKIVHIDGDGSVGRVHDRIQAELEACSLV